MIIVKIHYGLGNQLFQYALAKSLSLQRGIAFRLDTSFFNGVPDKDHPRIYQLCHFNIIENIAEPKEIDGIIKPGFLKRRWRNMMYIGLPYYKKKVVYENGLSFNDNIFRVKDNSYLFGYWQDERYFSAVQDELRKDLTFKTAPSPKNKSLLQQIQETASVCIHIRRGDYLTDQSTATAVGICDLPYYYKAIEIVKSKVNNPVFYIFSDEMEWVKREFKIDQPCVYVDHNSQEVAFEDLRLMSTCKNHILANSSFSWWGAWLSNNKDKVVVAPKVWRKQGPDMYLPKGWVPL
jgi:glycosyl transferase family 11